MLKWDGGRRGACTRLDGLQPLHIACLKGHFRVVTQLIAAKASVTATVDNTDTGSTPLHLACKSGSADIASALIVAGAGIEAVVEAATRLGS